MQDTDIVLCSYPLALSLCLVVFNRELLYYAENRRHIHEIYSYSPNNIEYVFDSFVYLYCSLRTNTLYCYLNEARSENDISIVFVVYFVDFPPSLCFLNILLLSGSCFALLFPSYSPIRLLLLLPSYFPLISFWLSVSSQYNSITTGKQAPLICIYKRALLSLSNWDWLIFGYGCLLNTNCHRRSLKNIFRIQLSVPIAHFL